MGQEHFQTTLIANNDGTINYLKEIDVPVNIRLQKISLQTYGSCKERIHQLTFFINGRQILSTEIKDCLKHKMFPQIKINSGKAIMAFICTGFDPNEKIEIKGTIDYEISFFSTLGLNVNPRPFGPSAKDIGGEKLTVGKSQKIQISGLIEITDDESSIDEKEKVEIDEFIWLSKEKPKGTLLEFDKCAGGEVRLTCKLKAKLNNSGSVTVYGKFTLYEGASCNTEDKEDEKKIDVVIRPNSGSKKITVNLLNSGIGGGDTAKGKIHLTNVIEN